MLLFGCYAIEWACISAGAW